MFCKIPAFLFLFSLSDEIPTSGPGNELRGDVATYYQGLIDQRDCPYIVRKLYNVFCCVS